MNLGFQKTIIRLGSQELIANYLLNGGNVNAQDDQGNTLLHYSYLFDAKDLIEFLRQSKGSEDIENHNNIKPADMRENINSTLPMEEKKATRKMIDTNPNLQDTNGNTPLHRRAQEDEVNKVLIISIFYKGDLSIKNNEELTPLDLLSEKSKKEFYDIQNHYSELIRSTPYSQEEWDNLTSNIQLEENYLCSLRQTPMNIPVSIWGAKEGELVNCEYLPLIRYLLQNGWRNPFTNQGTSTDFITLNQPLQKEIKVKVKGKK